MARALPSRVASTAEKVQGDEYFDVEEIRGWRWGKEGREYLVKWARYGSDNPLCQGPRGATPRPPWAGSFATQQTYNSIS